MKRPPIVGAGFGDGFDHETGGTIVLWNTPDSSVYMFEGDIGDKGTATYMGYGGNWAIENLECP